MGRLEKQLGDLEDIAQSVADRATEGASNSELATRAADASALLPASLRVVTGRVWPCVACV